MQGDMGSVLVDEEKNENKSSHQKKAKKRSKKKRDKKKQDEEKEKESGKDKEKEEEDKIEEFGKKEEENMVGKEEEDKVQEFDKEKEEEKKEEGQCHILLKMTYANYIVSVIPSPDKLDEIGQTFGHWYTSLYETYKPNESWWGHIQYPLIRLFR